MALHTFKYPYTFPLELGGELAGFQLAYTTHGKLNADGSNVLWVCHALTGSSDPTDWWDGLVGKDLHYDPKDWFIVCVNVLGSHYGSTNALSNNPKRESLIIKLFLTFRSETILMPLSCYEKN